MADISIQFHAAPNEIRGFVYNIWRDRSLSLVAIELNPFNVWSIENTDDFDLAFDKAVVRRLALFASKPCIDVKGNNELADLNPDRLLIDIGRLKDNKLSESWLTAREQDPHIFRKWKDIANKLKSLTYAGCIAMNPKTGATSKLRNHRYSKGALFLQEKGVAMLPAAGHAILKLGCICCHEQARTED